MRILLTLAAVALVGAPAFGQMATSPSMTRSRMTVMPHCTAGNPVVWVNTRSHVYYTNGSTYYRTSTHGRYVCRNKATAMGAHRAGMTGTSSMTHGAMMHGSMAHGAKYEGPLMSPHPVMSPMRNGSMGLGTAPPASRTVSPAAGTPPAASSPLPVPVGSGGAPAPGPSLSP